jgi:hypothetical protein
MQCIVDAENAAEIAACLEDPDEFDVFSKLRGFFQLGTAAASTAQTSVVPGVPFDECIVDAENALEQQACYDDAK